MLAVLLGVKWAKERELLGCVVDVVFVVVVGEGGGGYCQERGGMVLLGNGGSCNACTLKRCIIVRCITQHSM